MPEPDARVTGDGLVWMHERLAGEVDAPTAIALGEGESKPSFDDTDLDDEVVRRDITDNNAEMFVVSDVPEIRFRITVQAGTDVPAGTDITELGVFGPNDELIYREVRLPIEMDQGVRRTIDTRLSLVEP